MSDNLSRTDLIITGAVMPSDKPGRHWASSDSRNTVSVRYALEAPLLIGSHLTPAVAVGDGYVSVEAHGVEDGGRAHFRVRIDAPDINSWQSEDSFVTTVGRTWTVAAVMALETVCDALGSDEGPAVDGLPADIVEWLSEGAHMDAMVAAEDLRELLERL